MRFRHFDDSHARTAAFAVVHLAIAVTVGWLLTGTFVLGGLLALVEPILNTLAGHHLDKAVSRMRSPPRRRAWVHGALLASTHLVVAIACGWWLSNSLAVATAYALIEPLANALAYQFFSRWWAGRRLAQQAPIARLAHNGRHALCES